MTSHLGFIPYTAKERRLQERSVPLCVVILAKDEAVNIARAVESSLWAQQVLVVDSGSSDGTAEIAQQAGAEVHHTHWRGFAGQRNYALQLEQIRFDWIYMLDADEWFSTALALEVRDASTSGDFDAYFNRLRLVFCGRWIRHCGWYSGSWVVRLMDRRMVKFGNPAGFGERASVEGSVGRLRHDVVDEDLKGIDSWLAKHARYAALSSESGGSSEKTAGIPFGRYLAKRVFAVLPAKGLIKFVYMYGLRLGFLDGHVGLHFCLLHAAYEQQVSSLRSLKAATTDADRQ